MYEKVGGCVLVMMVCSVRCGDKRASSRRRVDECTSAWASGCGSGLQAAFACAPFNIGWTDVRRTTSHVRLIPTNDGKGGKRDDTGLPPSAAHVASGVAVPV